MRRLAKILLAGTVLAIPLTPPLCTVAISQSTVYNNQVELGDVVPSETLNVVTADSTSASSVAAGNTASSGVVSGSMDVQSRQQLGSRAVSPTVSASTTVNVVSNDPNVTANAGEAVVSAAATGNQSDSGSFDGGGALTGTFVQNARSVDVTNNPTQVVAGTTFNGVSAEASDLSLTTQAIANSSALTVENTSANVTTRQNSSALTEADGAGTLMYTGGTVTATAAAVSNNMVSTGTDNASQSLNTTQSMTGARTQATQSMNVGNGQTVITATTASDNNIVISNENGPLNVVDKQTNNAFTLSQAVGSSYEFGTGTTSANAVGNSVLVGNAGPLTTLDNTQDNVGNGIEANASFGGNNGYDAASSASAMGNAVTGYACSDCGGVVNVTNNQTNTGQVGATSTLDITASNRSASGTAVAVGNNATFYVSKPSH
jgi:hypothetical protein